MHRNHQFANTRAMGYEPWLLRRLAWLACAGLVGLLGLALHLLQAPAPAVPGPGPAVVIQSPAVDQFTAMFRNHSACGGAQSHASCGEVEHSEVADPEFLTGFRVTLAVVHTQQPAWALDPAGLARGQPLLRPPRRQG